jgi:hypothetical protein
MCLFKLFLTALFSTASPVRPHLCYCRHCHGLGCGGWCRWCL